MPDSEPISQLFAQAFRDHQAGRWAEAERGYRQVLATNPRQAEAWHLLGCLASQTGRPEEAVGLIRRAIELAPNSSAFSYNLGFSLRALGRLEECADAYRRATEIQPDYAMAHNNLGSVLQELGLTDEALAAFREAIRLDPQCVFAQNNAGNVLRSQGRLDEAIAAYRRAIQIQPQYADVHTNLGIAYTEKGVLDAAIAAHEESLRLNPDAPMTYCNLGVTLSALGRVEETVAACRRALALKPDYPEGHYNLGVAYGKLGRLDEAVAAYREAIRYQPGSAEAWNNMGTALKELGQLDAALDAYRQAAQLRPDRPLAESNRLLTLHCVPEIEPAVLFEEHRRWDERHAQSLLGDRTMSTNDRDPRRRLRVGYVSADFRWHAVASFVEDLLKNHDPAQVEVFGYSNATVADAVTARLRQRVPHWREIAGLSDAAVADVIRGDAIDILVDLGGHTADNRLLVFARRPAPIQITYLGYCDTTGMRAMDHRFTDECADPPGVTEQWNTERLVRLAGGAWCFRPLEEAPPVRGLPAGWSGSVNFGCFNALSKITEPHAALWSRIMQRVPGSRLLLKNAGLQNASARERTLAMLERVGVARDRIELMGSVPDVVAHLECYGRVDVALDTFPYHGTTTTCEALWMGVPVVTLAGKTHASRVGVSLLTHLGASEWVAEHPDDYVRIAAELAGDLSNLSKIRAQLRQRLQASPLMDGARLARAVEDAFRKMWRSWCTT